MALTNDHNLALKLVVEQPFNTNMFNRNPYKRILQGINEIKEKYFANLLDQSTFTISSYVREMSNRQASNHTNYRSPPTP
jgi:hypothetical protein